MQPKCRRDKLEPECRCRHGGDQPTSPVPVSHKHDNLIRAIFHDPVSGNLQWREVESLLRHLGATIESLSGTRIVRPWADGAPSRAYNCAIAARRNWRAAFRFVRPAIDERTRLSARSGPR